MTDPNPITPPPELVRQWTNSAHLSQPNMGAICREVATQAARWAADQELEACCEWLDVFTSAAEARDLRAARRPVQPSLKERALEQLREVSAMLQFHTTGGETSIIRRALEQLPDATPVTPDPAPTAGFWERHTMGVCPVCGNKRCPKAADPAMTCTGSNEPGQPGSAYANPAPTADDRGKLGGAIHAGTVTTHTITKSPDPAPTEGVPLWELMQKAHDKAATNRGGYAAQLRVVADQIQQQFQDREGILELGVRGVVAWLRAEADRTEAEE